MEHDRTKLCGKCRHFGRDASYRECTRRTSVTTFDIAWGDRTVTTTKGNVDKERIHGECGPSGRFYEPKPPKRSIRQIVLDNLAHFK